LEVSGGITASTTIFVTVLDESGGIALDAFKVTVGGKCISFASYCLRKEREREEGHSHQHTATKCRDAGTEMRKESATLEAEDI
jgi:hypothetical protein